MKKIIIAALASAVLVLGGCASGSNSSSASSSGADPSSAASQSAFSNMSDTVGSDEASSSASSDGFPSAGWTVSSDSASAASGSASAASSQSAASASDSASAEAPDTEGDDEQSSSEESAKSDTLVEVPKDAVLLSDFTVLSQYPELPNGCEVTTLTAVLNYQGLEAEKTVLSDDYLPKAPVGEANFYREFVGNPRDDDAYGCYAPVVVTTAESYIDDSGSGLTVSDLTGASFQDLFGYIDQGIPVIVWATQYNQQGHYSVTWHVDGQDMTWFTPEHCIALVGYDLDDWTVTVADPMTGELETYDLDAFESNYNDLHQQAIVIR